MDTTKYTYLLANPQKMTTEDVSALESVLQKYPYFQSARALQLKGLKNEDSFLYNDALKVTAAYTTDRDILFEYITSEKFIQNEISQVILQHDESIAEIKVVSESISEQVSFELDRQIKAELQKAEAILNPELFERKFESVSRLVEKKEATPEEILQPNRPLKFTEKDSHSFSEWLKLTKARIIKRGNDLVKTEEPKDDKQRKFELIEKFIQEKPRIQPTEIEHNKDPQEERTNLATAYAHTSESLMTETLAKVYLQQKNYKKAIQAYKILILKNPEKSGFFADQIRAIEKLINTEES